jgi:hypothetical protein
LCIETTKVQEVHLFTKKKISPHKIRDDTFFFNLIEAIILRVIRFCANIQLSPSDPITKLAYCRGWGSPDNLVEIDSFYLYQISHFAKIFYHANQRNFKVGSKGGAKLSGDPHPRQ